MPMQAYSAFGLRVAATGRLPGLLPCREPGVADVHVYLQATPEWLPDENAHPHGALYVRADRDETGRPVPTIRPPRRDQEFRVPVSHGIAIVRALARQIHWSAQA